MITKKTDLVNELLGLLPSQFVNKERLTELVRATSEEVQTLEDVAFDLLEKRLLSEAIGSQLDVLGSVLGEQRQGQNDAVYLEALKNRIRINTGSATAEEIIAICLSFFGTSIPITLTEGIPAELEVYAHTTLDDPDRFFYLVENIRPVAVRTIARLDILHPFKFDTSGSTFDSDDVFTFARDR